MENFIHAKRVQEIAQSCKDEIPEKFVHKNGYLQSKVDSVPYMDDCIIDFSLLCYSSSSPEANRELSKLQLALTRWGCFQAVNHGITSEFRDNVIEVSKKFFALPLEEKLLICLAQIMSNGMLKSPVHRVIKNPEKEKITVAVFCYSEPEREVGPITGLITDDKPQMYKRVKHYQNIFFEKYQLGKRPLHAVRM